MILEMYWTKGWVETYCEQRTNFIGNSKLEIPVE